MINHENMTLSVYDYTNTKVGTIYAPKIQNQGFATDIVLTNNSSGWKEISFSILKKVDGVNNPLVEFLVNEYFLVVDDGQYRDKFIISEPNISHTKNSLSIDVKCNHVSARLRTKKLYLVFDDTNGIGKIRDLATIILQGTGWTLGTVDTFYEPDGVTEKIRTLKTSGKDGAYQLITKLCELFNARPVYNGDTQTVDLVAFVPYTLAAGATIPDLENPNALIELNYSKTMSGVSRTLSTNDMVTRLYVEGEYGDDGYLGIESVNPTGLNFIVNFDYLKDIGLFTAQHQTTVDNYITAMSAARTLIQTSSTTMSGYQTELMKLWGTADYSLFDITSIGTAYGVTHVTSLGEDKTVLVDQAAYLIFSDGTNVLTKVTDASTNSITLNTAATADKTPVSILVYRDLASGTIGGKELAIESAQEMYTNLMNRVGDNLVDNSDTRVSNANYMIGEYRLTENWNAGQKYTISIWGTVNEGNSFRVYRDDGYTLLGTPTFDAARKCYILTVTSPDTERAVKDMLRVYNYPSTTATQGTINRIKVEFGEIPTYWSAAEDSSQSPMAQEYRDRIELLRVGDDTNPGLYTLTTQAIQYARQLETERQNFNAKLGQAQVIEDQFVLDMGDLIRDGYWQDNNYVVGQEQSLFNDAVEVLSVMSKPVATYNVTVFNALGEDGKPLINGEVNAPVHIIDDDASINAWGYVDKASYFVDKPIKDTIAVTTKEAKFAGQSFSQIMSQIAETAKEVRSMNDVYKRASAIDKFGNIDTEALQGIIDTETTRLLSATSNWYTDERGNIVFVSHDGMSAMMLTGEGFMIAESKTPSGTWNWRTFGTGRGFTADAINAGTLNAGLIKILGTNQFYWDKDNIHVFDPENPLRQIRIGRYDGVNYGIAFTQDDGVTWESAIGFDGGHLGAAALGQVQQVVDDATANLPTSGNVNFYTTPDGPYRVGDTWLQLSSGKSYVCIRDRLTPGFDQADWSLKEEVGVIRRGTYEQMILMVGHKPNDIFVIENDPVTTRNGRTYYAINELPGASSWVMTSAGAISGASVSWNADTGEVSVSAGKKISVLSGGELEMVGNNKVTLGTGGELSVVGSTVTVDAASTFNLRAGATDSGLGISNDHIQGYAFWAGDIDPTLADFSVKKNGDIIANRISVSSGNITSVDASTISEGFLPLDRIEAGTITAGKIYSGEVEADLITGGHIRGGTITGDKIYSGLVQADRITADNLYAGDIHSLRINTDNLAAGSITTQTLAAGVVTADKIYSGSVEADKITTKHIATGSITADLIEGGTITGEKIFGGTITGDKIYAGELEANKIQAGSIGADQITTTHLAAGSVTADQIFAGSIQATHIGAEVINAGHIAANSIQSGHIASEQILAGHIAPNSIDANHIQATSIQTNHIASLTIEGWHIQGNTITGEKIVAETIVGENLAVGTITSQNIASQSIEANKLYAGELDALKISAGNIAAGAITSTHIAAGTITADSAVIANGAITNAMIGLAAIEMANIADLSVDSAKMADLSVTTAKIADLAVDNAKLGALAVDTINVCDAAIQTAQIADLSVSTAKIADLAVESAKINNAAITSAKIEDLAVTEAKIDDLAVSSAKIGYAAITSAKIAEAAIETAHIADASIVSAKIKDLAVETAHIADGAITTAKIGTAQILSANIGDAQITNAHIDTAGIDFAHINNVSITEGMIGNSVIKTTHIAEGSITDALIGNLSANKIDAGTLSVDRLIIRGTTDSILYQLNQSGGITSQYVSQLDGGILADETVHADKIISDTILARHIAADQINSTHILSNSITADHIAAYTITSDQIAANTITVDRLVSNFASSLDLSSNNSIRLIVTPMISSKAEKTELADYAKTTAMETFVGAQFKIVDGKVTTEVTNRETAISDIVGANGTLTTFMREVTNWQTFDENGLTLGKTGSPFQVVLNTEKLAFMQDGVEIAYLSNNKLYISASEIVNELVIGNPAEGYMTLDVFGGGLVCTRSLQH